MFNLKELWRDLVYTRNMIWGSLILFTLSIFYGASSDSFANFLDQQLRAVAELADLAEGAENSTLAFILIIFINNAVKCVMVIFLGLFFGLYPLFFITMNGLMIGYLLKLASDGLLKYDLFDTIVKGLLPHGILEIPALIIATAYGLRMGRLVIKTILLSFKGEKGLKGIGKVYKGTMKRALVISVYLVIVLAVASIIESTITVWLLSL